MADPKFGFSVGPYSADFSLSDLAGNLKDEAFKELQRRALDIYKADYAIGQSAPVQALQGVEFRTPAGNFRPFQPSGGPIPKIQEPPPSVAPKPAPAPTRSFVSGQTQYTPAPPQLASIPDPSGRAPAIVDPGKLYEAIGSEAYEPPAYVEPTTVVQAEPMSAPPSAGEKGPGFDWRAAIAALQPIARGLREPSTTRPYARMGYFAQLEDEQKREQELKMQQFGSDAAMARQEADNRARAQIEREQISAQLERERMSEQAAMERAQLEARTRQATQEHPLTAEQATALGLPPGAVGLPANVAGSYAAQAAADKRLTDYYSKQEAERKASEARYRLSSARQALQSPQALMDPVYKAQVEAEIDSILQQYFPTEFTAGQTARQKAASAMATPPPAAQPSSGGFHPLDWLKGLFGGGEAAPTAPGGLPPGPGSQMISGLKVSDSTRRILTGIDSRTQNPIDVKREVERTLLNDPKTPPEDKAEIMRFLASLQR